MVSPTRSMPRFPPPEGATLSPRQSAGATPQPSPTAQSTSAARGANLLGTRHGEQNLNISVSSLQLLSSSNRQLSDTGHSPAGHRSSLNSTVGSASLFFGVPGGLDVRTAGIENAVDSRVTAQEWYNEALKNIEEEDQRAVRDQRKNREAEKRDASFVAQVEKMLEHGYPPTRMALHVKQSYERHLRVMQKMLGEDIIGAAEAEVLRGLCAEQRREIKDLNEHMTTIKNRYSFAHHNVSDVGMHTKMEAERLVKQVDTQQEALDLATKVASKLRRRAKELHSANGVMARDAMFHEDDMAQLRDQFDRERMRWDNEKASMKAAICELGEQNATLHEETRKWKILMRQSIEDIEGQLEDEKEKRFNDKMQYEDNEARMRRNFNEAKESLQAQFQTTLSMMESRVELLSTQLEEKRREAEQLQQELQQTQASGGSMNAFPGSFSIGRGGGANSFASGRKLRNFRRQSRAGPDQQVSGVTSNNSMDERKLSFAGSMVLSPKNCETMKPPARLPSLSGIMTPPQEDL